MNPWRDVLKSLQVELDRLSQEIEGRIVVPNGVTAVLPSSRFERWAPILEAVTAELGEALVAWVESSRRAWYAETGPFLSVRLDAEISRSEITCGFLERPPGEHPATREEPLPVEAAVDEGSAVVSEASYIYDSEPPSELREAPGGDREPADEPESPSPVLGQVELDSGSGQVFSEPPEVGTEEALGDPDSEDFNLSQFELD